VAYDKTGLIHLFGGLDDGKQGNYRLLPHNGVYGPLDDVPVHPGPGAVVNEYVSRVPGGKESEGPVDRGAARGTSAYETDRRIGGGLPGLKEGGGKRSAGRFLTGSRVFGDGNNDKADTRGGGKSQDCGTQDREGFTIRTGLPRQQRTVFLLYPSHTTGRSGCGDDRGDTREGRGAIHGKVPGLLRFKAGKDKGFRLFFGLLKGKSYLVFQKFQSAVIKFPFQNGQFFDLTPVIERPHNGGNVRDFTLLQEIQILLIPELPVGRDRFVIFAEHLQGSFGLILWNNGPDTQFFCIFNGNHDGHIRNFKINHIVRDFFALEVLGFDSLDNPHTLAGIYYLLIYTK
jgi:hypothetical protein